MMVRGLWRMVCFGVSWAAVLLSAPLVLAEPVRVMTFNVRYGTANDGPNHWDLRREILLGVVKEFDPDVLGVQEALRDQLVALVEALPGHVCVGVGREADGGGEYSALFYRRSRFDLAAADTIWLSETPGAPGSRTWGNELPRICTWARLLDRNDARRFTVFNTHWDHQSQSARERSGQVMATLVAELSVAGEPVLVTGDYNAGEDNAAIANLTRGGELLRDTFRVVHPDEREVGTFNGFQGLTRGPKIDAVFATPEWQVQAADIIRTHQDERYPSDHFPVTATVEL
jgi:endonuclease/exonuclease/phosphatase family metal-dependent hydrolase